MVKKMSKEDSFDLSQYQLLDKIGCGSFFDVYKVEEKNTSNIHAAKIFRNNSDEIDTDEQRRITDMLAITKSINHPSILKFIGFSPVDFKLKNRPTIITEFMPNGSLCRKSLSPRELNSTKVLINIYGIAAALSYLHSNDILHLDIKPENILLDESLYPKLCDFYLSTHIDNIPNSIVGTPVYISPEIFKDLSYSKASDVYAFGLTIYQLITNKIPFDGCPMFELVTKITRGVRPKIPEEVPKAYKELIESCWAENPSDRPTFDSILAQLTENKDFITETVNENEFQQYVDYIKNSPKQ